ncbi:MULTISPECIES: response regulator [unclassified Mucilaginibacter]|uniref:response regulator n=1 Tax=unclassified Mucilaginibacter TaxID=2617802 RepID=UPI0031F66E2F
MAKKRILLIEDSDDIQAIVQLILEDEGYEVVAANPRPVTEWINDNADLIVLDEWINEQEGHMLCREIKKMQILKHVPVIIFSTAPNIEAIVETCGAEGFVRKPFDIDDLLKEINRCLYKKGSSKVTLI